MLAFLSTTQRESYYMQMRHGIDSGNFERNIIHYFINKVKFPTQRRQTRRVLIHGSCLSR